MQRQFTAAKPNQLRVSVRYTERLAEAEVIHHAGPWRGFDDVEYAMLEWVA